MKMKIVRDNWYLSHSKRKKEKEMVNYIQIIYNMEVYKLSLLKF